MHNLQQLFWDKRYSHTRISGTPDFVKLAEAYGALGLRVEEPADVESALRQAFDDPRTAVIDFRVEPEEEPGLVHVQAILRDMEGVAFIYLDQDDIVRHPLVKRIVSAYERGEARRKR